MAFFKRVFDHLFNQVLVDSLANRWVGNREAVVVVWCADCWWISFASPPQRGAHEREHTATHRCYKPCKAPVNALHAWGLTCLVLLATSLARAMHCFRCTASRWPRPVL